MNKQQEAQLEKQFKSKLQEQFTRGLSQGSKAITGVILEKAKLYNGNNADEVIAEIIRFCEVGLGLKKEN